MLLISEEKDGYFTRYTLYNIATKTIETIVLNPKGEKVFTFNEKR